MPVPEVERRKVERITIEKPARLRPNEWSRVSVNVIDLSSLGFRAAGDIQLRPGGYLALEVPGVGIMDAKVVWQQHREFGAQFLRPLPLDHCAWTSGPTDMVELEAPDVSLTPPKLAQFLASYVDARTGKPRGRTPRS